MEIKLEKHSNVSFDICITDCVNSKRVIDICRNAKKGILFYVCNCCPYTSILVSGLAEKGRIFLN